MLIPNVKNKEWVLQEELIQTIALYPIAEEFSVCPSYGASSSPLGLNEG